MMYYNITMPLVNFDFGNQIEHNNHMKEKNNHIICLYIVPSQKSESRLKWSSNYSVVYMIVNK